jgi:hypothetical protein
MLSRKSSTKEHLADKISLRHLALFEFTIEIGVIICYLAIFDSETAPGIIHQNIARYCPGETACRARVNVTQPTLLVGSVMVVSKKSSYQ